MVGIGDSCPDHGDHYIHGHICLLCVEQGNPKILTPKGKAMLAEMKRSAPALPDSHYMTAETDAAMDRERHEGRSNHKLERAEDRGDYN